MKLALILDISHQTFLDDLFYLHEFEANDLVRLEMTSYGHDTDHTTADKSTDFIVANESRFFLDIFAFFNFVWENSTFGLCQHLVIVDWLFLFKL